MSGNTFDDSRGDGIQDTNKSHKQAGAELIVKLIGGSQQDQFVALNAPHPAARLLPAGVICDTIHSPANEKVRMPGSQEHRHDPAGFPSLRRSHHPTDMRSLAVTFTNKTTRHTTRPRNRTCTNTGSRTYGY
jgi:hypothetical protein